MPIKTAIRSVLPFRFLSTGAIEEIVQSTKIESFGSQSVLMKQGDTSNLDVYLIVEGSVEVLDERSNPARRHTVIASGHYVGEWEPIFETPRVYTVKTTGPCKAIKIAGGLFLKLFREETAFRLAFSAILRDVQGIFSGFELFRAEIFRGVGHGHFHLNKLLPLYLALNPALHSKSNDEKAIDFSALDYAVRRLPANVGTTFAFLIRDELPAVFEEPDLLFKPIATDARRRSVWEVLPGKDLITVRSGISDIIDFLTCLCVYAVEARKIRKRLYAASAIRALKDHLDAKDSPTDLRIFVESLGFTPEEVDGFLRVWPLQSTQQLWNIINHREMFSVDIRRQLSQYNLKSFTLWSRQISEAMVKLTGFDPKELPSGVDVHIISSNTHSIANCLNPWFAKEKSAILAWAKAQTHQSLDENWFNQFDLVYSLTREYLLAHPDKVQAMIDSEIASGIYRLQATATTGIEVQLIDTGKNAKEPIDDSLPAARTKRQILVNIDYAFGEQAEDILQQLVLLFGKNIKSVNFLGKAGALVGRRGDILVPQAFLDQSSDGFQNIDQDAHAYAASIARRLPNQAVHTGPMLTVQGTLLQNRDMLNFYKRVWDIQGIEMEGFYYHRQCLEARDIGYADKALVSRFMYYVSDLPLDTASNLSERLKASEGVPPLYAISREILAQILL